MFNQACTFCDTTTQYIAFQLDILQEETYHVLMGGCCQGEKGVCEWIMFKCTHGHDMCWSGFDWHGWGQIQCTCRIKNNWANMAEPSANVSIDLHRLQMEGGYMALKSFLDTTKHATLGFQQNSNRVCTFDKRLLPLAVHGHGTRDSQFCILQEVLSRQQVQRLQHGQLQIQWLREWNSNQISNHITCLCMWKPGNVSVVTA